MSQSRTPEAPTVPGARGLYNWIHSTADAERSFQFYRDVFGIELASSPFAASSDAPPEPIRSAANAGSDPLVWDLTNTRGSRFRTVFMRASNTPFGLELSEFFDVPRNDRKANTWDPGASRLIFDVRDFDVVMARLKARGSPVVTAGGAALDTPMGRAILVRDPDGYLVEVRQASPRAVSSVSLPGNVIETSIAITVGQRTRALDFYQGLLGFDAGPARQANAAELRVLGLTAGGLTETRLAIPGNSINIILSEIALPDAAGITAAPFDWRIQDVGAPQLQLEVIGIDALIERTKASGYRFLSVGARPIQRPFGRFVFAIDADGILVEFVEPVGSRR